MEASRREPTDDSVVVVENESPLPIQVADDDVIAIGTREEDLPSLDECRAVYEQQEKFSKERWKPPAPQAEPRKDEVREVPSDNKEEQIVIVVHNVPRKASCDRAELGEPWAQRTPTRRITT